MNPNNFNMGIQNNDNDKISGNPFAAKNIDSYVKQEKEPDESLNDPLAGLFSMGQDKIKDKNIEEMKRQREM